MSKPESDAPVSGDAKKSAGAEVVVDTGWSFDDGGSFASEHTTVDPTLLERLAALDGNEDDAISLDDDDELMDIVDSGDVAAMLSGVLDDDDDDDDDPADRTMAMEVPAGAIEAAEQAAAEQAAAEQAAAEQAAAEQAAPDENPTEQLADHLDLGPMPKPPSDDLGAMPVPPKGLGAGAASDDDAGPSGAAGESVAKASPSPADAMAEGSIELDDDLANYDMGQEKTQVFMPAMEDEPTRAKLLVQQGGGQQKEFLLARDRVTMGRGTNNDILIPDIAISRQHCEIIRVGDGQFRLRDMSSGNGTKLNGARVLEADLRRGDRIELGGTILELSLEGAGVDDLGERRITYHPSESGGSSSTSSGPRTDSGAQQLPVRGPASARPPADIPDYSTGHNATVTAYQPLPPEPVESSSSSSNLIITLLIGAFGILFLLLAGIIGAKIFLDYQAQKGETTVAAKPASDYYFEGLELAKAREWDKAEAKFKVASDLAREEGDFQVRKDAQTQLELVQRERGFLKAYDRGRELLEEKQFEEGISALESVRSGSTYYKEARSNIDSAKNDWAVALTMEAEKDFEAKRYADADRKIGRALTARPDYEAAQNISKKLRELPVEEYEPEPEPVVTARNNDRKPVARRTPTVTRTDEKKGKNNDKTPTAAVANTNTKKPKTGPPAGGGDFSGGVALFRNRQFDEAAKFFEGIAATDDSFNGKKAANLARSVRSFKTHYTSGIAAYKARDYPKATRHLTNATRLDNVISGGGGAFRAELREMLAESHYQQARAAYNGQNFALAGTNAKKALLYKPNHPGNQALINQLEGKARGMYVEAINKKSSDPKQAKRIAQNIVAMLPASSDTYKKAKKLLSEL